MNRHLFCSSLTSLLGLVAVYLTVAYNNARDHRGITRSAILHPTISPWRQILNYGDENFFITLTGFSREAFDFLHSVLFANEDRTYRTGRKRLTTTRDELGILLFYCGSRMNLNEFCLIFGVTPSRCSEIVRNMLFRSTLIRKDHKARIHWPSTLQEKIHQFMML